MHVLLTGSTNHVHAALAYILQYQSSIYYCREKKSENSHTYIAIIYMYI